MVYLFRYRQGTRDEAAYRAVCRVLDELGFLHEVARGELLVAPACQVYLLREKLGAYVGAGDQLTITPVVANDFTDTGAHRFVSLFA